MGERARFLLWAALAGLAMPPLSFLAGGATADVIDVRGARLLVPLLMVLPFYPAYLILVKRGRFALAVGVSLFWALCCSLSTIPYVVATGDAAEPVIWNAAEYRAEMFSWIRTGVGAESDPSLYLPEHAQHFCGFALLSVLTAGFAGLALGAALLNYMNYYVGCLFLAATEPLTIAVFGWPVYAMVRVVGFVVTAVALTGFGLRVFRVADPGRGRIRVTLLIGVGLVILDALLKWWIAPINQGILEGAIAG